MLKRVIKFSISLLIMMSGCIQVVNAQELKKYSGPFSINDIKGVAEYTYKDAPDGTRIFQGDFKFTASQESIKNLLDDEYSGLENINYEEMKLTAQGNFDNNYQVGEWVWKGPWPIGIKNFYKNQILKYTFSDIGKMEGPAYFYGDENDTYTITIKDNEPKGRFDFTTKDPNYTLIATWQDGHLVGDYLLIIDNAEVYDWNAPGYKFGNVTKGQFNDKGDPVGKWTSEWKGEEGGMRYQLYSNLGDPIECYSIDNTTGDKIRCNCYITPVRFNTALFNARDRFKMRSTRRDY